MQSLVYLARLLGDHHRFGYDGRYCGGSHVRLWKALIRSVATIAIALILLLGIDEEVNFGLNQLITRLTGSY
jgi:hypothetical protein